MKKINFLEFLTFFLFLFFFFNQFFILSKNYIFFDKLNLWMIILSIFILFFSLNSFSFSFNNNFIFVNLNIILFSSIIFYFSSSKFLWIFIFFEFSIFPIFFILLGWGYQLERIQSSYYLLMYTLFLSLPLFLCFIIFMFYYMNSFFWMKEKIIFSNFIFLFILMAFLVKSPIYFFHLWLPKAHVEAPVMGSIILAGILLKLGGYGFLRFIILFKENNFFLNLLFIFCLMGSLLSLILCFLQSDQKSMIAYASVNHMTLLIMVLIWFSSFSVKTCILLMFCHGIISSSLFFLSGLFFYFSFNRLISLNQGIMFISSGIFMLMIAFFLFNFSVPPMITFFSEIFILSMIFLWSEKTSILIFCFVFGGCLYSIYFIMNSFHGKWQKSGFFLFQKSIFLNFSFLIFMFSLFFMLTFLL